MSSEMRGGKEPGRESRISQVRNVVEGLLKITDSGGLKEEESAQPENLTQSTARDGEGNIITFIYNNTGRLETDIEVRDSNGKLIAQSIDQKNWFVDRYTAEGAPDFDLPDRADLNR